jgi:hypothetical protein
MEGTMRNSERGQALPLALLVLAAGMLIAAPFLGHASSNIIGSRAYAEVMTGQYSCDSGVEWGLWRLKENPTLTTSPNYSSAPLAPFPSEINGDAFPSTEIRYIEGAVGTATITPAWQDGQGWHDYPVGDVIPGTLTVVIDNITASQNVQIRLKNPSKPTQTFQGDGPYIASFEIGSPSASCLVQVKLPSTKRYHPMGPGPITITISYPGPGGGTGVTETIIPQWQTGPSWVYYPFRATDTGTATVTVECDAQIIRIKLYGSSYPQGSYSAPGGTYTVPVGAVSPSQPDQQIMVQTCNLDSKGREVPYYGPGTITIAYPISSYDIRAEQGERSLTVRITASYLATRVISWQIE